MPEKKRGIQLKQVHCENPGFSERLGDGFKGTSTVPDPPAPLGKPMDPCSLYELAQDVLRDLEETLRILKQTVSDGAAGVTVPMARTDDQEA
jgi:hypothetical protein